MDFHGAEIVCDEQRAHHVAEEGGPLMAPCTKKSLLHSTPAFPLQHPLTARSRKTTTQLQQLCTLKRKKDSAKGSKSTGVGSGVQPSAQGRRMGEKDVKRESSPVCSEKLKSQGPKALSRQRDQRFPGLHNGVSDNYLTEHTKDAKRCQLLCA